MTKQPSSQLPSTESPVVALQQLASGHFLSQAIYVAAAFGVADILRHGPQPYRLVADKAGADASSLRRVMRLLASAGVLEEKEDGAFALTALGEPLRSDAQRARFMLINSPTAFKAWSGLLHTIRTGETAFDHVFGMGAFDYFKEHPEEAAVFNQAMSGGTALMAKHIVDAYDFSRFESIMDVGGGEGALIAAILSAAPNVRGVLFDLPAVTPAADRRIAEGGLVGRCQIVSGDFLRDDLPTGVNAIALKHVIHDWDEQQAVRILEACRRALASGGTLLIVEGIFPERIDQCPLGKAAAQGDVNMMVNTGGRQRTAEEFRSILAAAGFDLRGIVPTALSQASIVEAWADG